ncbi:hypothetical protein [Candidatus Thiosymbion oneisti]|uniref:hypothetical protein n=1 Tax=Candidatus Thiosymbion oneisti TaxID=589554 RepID=UPI00114D386A|nr:hypothetical protein [Candidatus Thiosymbion oneisti]
MPEQRAPTRSPASPDDERKRLRMLVAEQAAITTRRNSADVLVAGQRVCFGNAIELEKIT